jgi:hypothetical protein
VVVSSRSEKLALSIVFVGLNACSVPLNPSRASAAKADESTRLDISLDRESVERIYRNELYATIIVVDCSSKQQLYYGEPRLNGRRLENFGFLRKHVGESHDKEFTISAQIRHVQPKQLSGRCVKLDGGSYFLQKITSAVIPIKVL